MFDLWLHLLLLYITKGTDATLLQLSVLLPRCWCCVLSLRCCRSAAAACISFMLLVCSALCSAPLCWYLCGGAAELCCQIGPCIAICCHPLCCCSLPPAGAGAVARCAAAAAAAARRRRCSFFLARCSSEHRREITKCGREITKSSSQNFCDL